MLDHRRKTVPLVSYSNLLLFLSLVVLSFLRSLTCELAMTPVSCSRERFFARPLSLSLSLTGSIRTRRCVLFFSFLAHKLWILMNALFVAICCCARLLRPTAKSHHCTVTDRMSRAQDRAIVVVLETGLTIEERASNCYCT